MKIKRNLGLIHFVGIGGIGMSGIAEVLNNMGYHVQGSDMRANANVSRMRDIGISVYIGHASSNLGDAELVVMSSAVQDCNIELITARRRDIPIITRAEMLAEIMRMKAGITVSGTHGKTTTTSLVAALLDAGGLDPTVINGGIINAYGTNAKIGDGKWIVVEADESDGSFVKLPTEIAIVTNMNSEHLDYYGDVDTMCSAFRMFLEGVPFYGFAVVCLDDLNVRNLISQVQNVRIITYGEKQDADVQLRNVIFDESTMCFDIIRYDPHTAANEVMKGFRLNMPGKHNALNAVAAIVIAREFGIDIDIIRNALAEFCGVKRRFTFVGSWNGISVIDDYAHHPVEIAMVLKTARALGKGRVISVIQPHRYSRLRNLFDDFCYCFSDADIVIVANVYSGGEECIEGIDRDALVAGLRASGHKHVITMDDQSQLPSLIATLGKTNDYVVCCGAGDITNWANILPSALASIDAGQVVVTDNVVK